MGVEQVTVKNLQVVEVDAKKNLITIKVQSQDTETVWSEFPPVK